MKNRLFFIFFFCFCLVQRFRSYLRYYREMISIFLLPENYKVETIPKGYEINMRLTIKSVQPQDFGSYRCVAKNSLGEMDGKIKLYSK